MDGFNQENSMILGLSMASGIGFMVAPQVLEKFPKIYRDITCRFKCSFRSNGSHNNSSFIYGKISWK
ncbi:hypothetical protein BM534_20465 [Clostridioides difficile]|nr:hypothetical protein BM534_20465 [Clostridioides difficile]